MSACILYYTDSRLGGRIPSMCQELLLASGLPIVSVSLEPLDFGRNIVVEGKPGIVTMYRQILAGLEVIDERFVFFAEHDVLYHPSHFEFRPPRIDTYYYNVNVWRWAYGRDWFITYDDMASLSGLCAGHMLLLCHYRHRLEQVRKQKLPDGRNPGWARKWGHEPGKPVARGGLLDERFETWRSACPNIDVRHNGCMTPQKMTLDSFRRLPTGWRESTIEDIDGWNREDLWGSIPAENRYGS